MNTYKIQHKIITLSSLDFFEIKWPEIDIEGFLVKNWSSSFWNISDWGGWLVSKEIDAENWMNAINKFRNEFQVIAQNLALVSQCYFDFLWWSYLIEKTNDNPERIFILKHINDIPPIWLVFTREYYESFKTIQSTPELKGKESFFTYMQEANNSFWYFARLSLLCGALESLAWRIEKMNEEWNPYFTYDKIRMKKILGWKLLQTIFWESWLRHKIQHGESISNFYDKDYVAIIYEKILLFLNEEYDLSLDMTILYPQRHYYGNSEYLIYPYRLKNVGKILDLTNFKAGFPESDNENDYVPVRAIEGEEY